MRIVFFGLSLSSSWGNGHATTYRALLRGLALRGHEILFAEREQPWYAANCDLWAPDFCGLHFYRSLDELGPLIQAVTEADAVVIGSYVPQAIELARLVDRHRTGALCFYDIDTPVTLRKLADGSCEYLSRAIMPAYDLYLSFTGGRALRILEDQYGVRRARALYCAVDSRLYHPTGAARRWDLGYLGTYSDDRQEALERLLIRVAEQRPDLRLVVAGSQYPASIAWPSNVERIEHLPPNRHADFYSSLGWALNVTRAEMVRLGFSPSVRLFEATACGTPVISDAWPGLGEVFAPGHDLLTAAGTGEVLAALALPEATRALIGERGRRRTLAQHTGEQRARELETLLADLTAPVPAE